MGIGCRRGVLEKTIEAFVSAAMQKAGVPLEAVSAVCSIDLKKEEAGLLGFCQSHHLPLTTYSAGQLMEAPGTFSPSGFVKQVTGVDNVCERAAVLGAGGCCQNRQAAALRRRWQSRRKLPCPFRIKIKIERRKLG